MRFISCIALAATLSAAHAQDPLRETVISAKDSRNDDVYSISSRHITPDCPHPWAIRKTTLRGGRQEGVDVIEVDNGRIKIRVCPTRGMGLLNVTMGDLELKWDSPVKEVVNPQFVNLESRGGLGWLEGFNEFMCRCGLESNGHPGTDKFINNVGDEAEMELTLHGKIANIPASRVEVIVERKAPYTIRVKGQVNERFLFGPKLELHTELVVVPGQSSFQLVDEVRNTGAQDQEFQMLYHANFGAPLLEEGAQVVVAADEVVPFNDHARKGLADWSVYAGPTTGFVEQVYLMKPKGDHQRNTTALLHNKSKSHAASISWSLKELPYLTVWKNTGAVADGYVTGIEPGTNYPQHRSVERAAGRVPVLKPGGTHKMTLRFGLHSGVSAVEAALKSVSALQLHGEGVDDPSIEKRIQ